MKDKIYSIEDRSGCIAWSYNKEIVLQYVVNHSELDMTQVEILTYTKGDMISLLIYEMDKELINTNSGRSLIRRNYLETRRSNRDVLSKVGNTIDGINEILFLFQHYLDDKEIKKLRSSIDILKMVNEHVVEEIVDNE